MITSRKVLQLLGASFGLAWLATACVRLNEPDKFLCNKDADCNSDERCNMEEQSCVAKDFCDNFYTICPEGQHCIAPHCVADECSSVTEATDCHGFLCTGGVCDKTCLIDCAVGFHCENSACVPGGLVANGAPCTGNAQCPSMHCCTKSDGSVGSFCLDSCPGPVGSSCATNADCASAHCCAAASGQLSCTAGACVTPSQPQCTSNAQCQSGYTCQSQKCVAVPMPKAAGEACSANSDCSTKLCYQNICRGDATTGVECKIDAECTTGRTCCTNLYSRSNKSCSDLNHGCPGSIGDKCEIDLDCLDMCDDYQCTKLCSADSDCGTSSWGDKNGCDDSLFGKICFAGCKTDDDCTINNAGIFCDLNTAGTAKICFR